MTARATASERGRRFRSVRGLTAGAVASFGALVAHAAGGGTLELVPGLVVAAVTLPLAVWLVGSTSPGEGLRAFGVTRLALTAAIAQLAAHLSLMLAPSAGAGHEHLGLAGAAAPSSSMAGHHLLIALLSVAVACGLDRGLVGLLRSLAGWLLPHVPGALVLPVRGALPAFGGETRLDGVRVVGVARPRAPPPGRSSSLPLAA